MAKATKDDILRALEEIRADLPSIEIEADRTEVSDAIDVVEHVMRKIRASNVRV